jgi:hypothetical protein
MLLQLCQVAVLTCQCRMGEQGAETPEGGLIGEPFGLVTDHGHGLRG